jgi:hypothetical protein
MAKPLPGGFSIEKMISMGMPSVISHDKKRSVFVIK